MHPAVFQKEDRRIMSQAPDKTELLVLDPRMPGWPILLAAADADSVVLVLDVARDGLAQILEVTTELAPLSAIHIVEPLGAAGLRLGGRLLEAAMDDEAAMLEALGENLLLDGVLTLCHGPGDLARAEPLAEALAAILNRPVMLVEAPAPTASPRPQHHAWPRSAKPPAILQSPWLAPQGDAARNGMEPRATTTHRDLTA